jgi:hypothetical protein
VGLMGLALRCVARPDAPMVAAVARPLAALGRRRQRRRRRVTACGGGVRLFSVTSDDTLRGEMKRYVKDMSGHKFAERGGDVLQICVFMTDIHNIIGLKK